MQTTKTRKNYLRTLTVTGILSALGAVLMVLEFPVPFMPSFVKFDFSELPALLATFSMGPVSGVAVCLVKNLNHLPFTSTGGVGELCNFLLGICFVLPAGILYRIRKNKLLYLFLQMLQQLFICPAVLLIVLPLSLPGLDLLL